MIATPQLWDHLSGAAIIFILTCSAWELFSLLHSLTLPFFNTHTHTCTYSYKSLYTHTFHTHHTTHAPQHQFWVLGDLEQPEVTGVHRIMRYSHAQYMWWVLCVCMHTLIYCYNTMISETMSTTPATVSATPATVSTSATTIPCDIFRLWPFSFKKNNKKNISHETNLWAS